MNAQELYDELDGEKLDSLPVVVAINGRMYEADDVTWNDYDGEWCPIISVTTDA